MIYKKIEIIIKIFDSFLFEPQKKHKIFEMKQKQNGSI